jgi:hypothetical protein
MVDRMQKRVYTTGMKTWRLKLLRHKNNAGREYFRFTVPVEVVRECGFPDSVLFSARGPEAKGGAMWYAKPENEE